MPQRTQEIDCKCRIGQGYDIHRLVPEKPLMLGGIHIESSVGSEAHSDGDVLLHALIDALLGAAGLGDIGDHFPPSDEQYRNIASSLLLEKSLELVRKNGFTVVNLDTTIFLEKPKLAPYKLRIREYLAAELDIPLEQVSVKAKTAEGFPPIGTQDAIAASATILLAAQQL